MLDAGLFTKDVNIRRDLQISANREETLRQIAKYKGKEASQLNFLARSVALANRKIKCFSKEINE